METVEEASRLECLMLDISPDANLDMLFRHLENSRFSELAKLEIVRNYLMDNGVYDKDGFIEYIDNEQDN